MSIDVRFDWPRLATGNGPRSPIGLEPTETGLSVGWDGRLDNADELGKALSLQNGVPTHRLIARAFRAWGSAFPSKLRGDFAVIVWDEHQRRAIAARDPFGIRPLYFRATREAFWLSSRIDVLLRTLDGVPRLDDRRVLEYLLGRYRTLDATFFSDVQEVPPGKVLWVNQDGWDSVRYWYPPAKSVCESVGDTRQYEEEFRRLFLRSVRLRLQSEKPGRRSCQWGTGFLVGRRRNE